jgi:hypothetical protein
MLFLMKKPEPVILALFVGMLFCVGCSDPAPGSGSSTEQTAKRPFEVEVVDSKEKQEVRRIMKQAGELLQGERYAELEALAHDYRTSQKSFPTGIWHLERFYDGLEIPRSEPDERWLNHISKLRAWIRKSPQSITPRVALADAWVSFAWKARGAGYANTVTDRAWTLYFARLEEAEKLLAAAGRLQEKCPFAAAVLLRVALGQSWDRKRYDAVFRQAVASHPGYLYHSARAYHLLPRWHGEPGEWESDLSKSADSIGGKAGDLLYARVAWSMSVHYGNVFKDANLSWARVQRGLAAMEEEFPESLYAASMRAYLAIMSGDRDTARMYTERLEGKVELAVWRSLKNYHQLMDWVYDQ